jgi:hypothetical protein
MLTLPLAIKNIRQALIPLRVSDENFAYKLPINGNRTSVLKTILQSDEMTVIIEKLKSTCA